MTYARSPGVTKIKGERIKSRPIASEELGWKSFKN